jgi:hypothetical protein
MVITNLVEVAGGKPARVIAHYDENDRLTAGIFSRNAVPTKDINKKLFLWHDGNYALSEVRP